MRETRKRLMELGILRLGTDVGLIASITTLKTLLIVCSGCNQKIRMQCILYIAKTIKIRDWDRAIPVFFIVFAITFRMVRKIFDDGDDDDSFLRFIMMNHY